jgi:hypothetical protein
MHWTDGVACFCAGLFLANATPHFVKGICGDRFPTPFAKPPGRGLSSPAVNVTWSLFNMLVDLLSGPETGRWILFAAVALFAVPTSMSFARKAKE